MKDLWPYVRQMQVVGEARQRELASLRAVVRGAGIGAELAVRYLRGGGVGEVIADEANAPVVDEITRAALEGIDDETARDAARGALEALAIITGKQP